MTQVDFWQLSRDPADKVTALIAGRVLGEGGRLLVVSDDAAQRAAISQALWAAEPPAFLANGDADAPHAARQPILLGASCAPLNGAEMCVLADGAWRDEARGFERVFLLFGEAGTPAARAVWRSFDGSADVTRAYYAQEAGRWVKKA